MVEQQDKESPKANVSATDLKRVLLEKIKIATAELKEIQSHFDIEEASLEDQFNVNQKTINTLQTLLKFSKPQEKDSLFIRNLMKPFREHLDQLTSSQESLKGKISPKFYSRRMAAGHERFVFVSLYQLDGYDLARWERQIQDLLRFNVARPVYSNENEIKKMIRAKLSKTPEAYLVISVDESHIVDGINSMDGEKKLIKLNEKAIKKGEIVEFVHLSRHYKFSNGKLVLINGKDKE